jgi:hypothetical protein
MCIGPGSVSIIAILLAYIMIASRIGRIGIYGRITESAVLLILLFIGMLAIYPRYREEIKIWREAKMGMLDK